MNRQEKQTIWGYDPVDLLGISLMIIPVIISFIQFPTSTRVISFIPWITKPGKQSITPDLTCGLCAIAFYAALIVRYDFFKMDSVPAALISSIRLLLNCWAVGALLSPIVSAKSEISILMFTFSSSTLLLFAVLLTWLGDKKIAGYSWILFILAAFRSWNEVSQVMGWAGALFIIVFGLSLFLQVRDTATIAEFAKSVSSKASSYAPGIRENINAAMDDAADKASAAANIARSKIDTVKKRQNSQPAYHINKDGSATPKQPSIKDPKDVLQALDVNGDGVIDEKDIELLNQLKK